MAEASMASGGRLPTVRDVALRAGVSPMTVSRTLAGGVNVRPDLQARVLEAASALGYRRNETARSLRPGQGSGLIGVAITELDNPYYGNFALGVEEVTAQHGMRMMLGNTGEDAAREQQLVSDFIGRQVEGLIVVPSGGGVEHLKPESLANTPLVLASRRVYGLDVDTVLIDDVGGAYRGASHLLDAGHTRIAYLGHPSRVFTSPRRFAGFEQALADRGIPMIDEFVYRDEIVDVESASVATRTLLDRRGAPTAIFADNNRSALGVLREIGRRLRENPDVSGLPAMVGFDGFELAELMPVPLAVVDHDARQLGREAARLLFERMGSAPLQQPARTLEVPAPLIVVRP